MPYFQYKLKISILLKYRPFLKKNALFQFFSFVLVYNFIIIIKKYREENKHGPLPCIRAQNYDFHWNIRWSPYFNIPAYLKCYTNSVIRKYCNHWSTITWCMLAPYNLELDFWPGRYFTSKVTPCLTPWFWH